MFRSILIAGLALAIGGASSAPAADVPAVFHVAQSFRAFHPDIARNWRGAKIQALKTTIWFPVDPGTPQHPHDIGPPGTVFFSGHPLATDTPISPVRTRWPLILLSHGTGGSADSLDWLAAALAASGYIVAAVDHPGNNALAPLSWDGFTLWWERATDISEVLDGLLSDPVVGPHIDRDRIGAAGFSLGGYTVLALAGARTNLPAFLAFCRSPGADAVCHPPEMARVVDRPDDGTPPSDQRAGSLARAAASYRDQRIKAVFAIAPAVGQAFDATSFADVTVPVGLLAGAADAHVPPDTNVRHVASLLPRARLEMLPGAGHYTFLPVCGPAMLARSPMLCTDGPGVDRQLIHIRTIDRVRSFFADTMK